MKIYVSASDRFMSGWGEAKGKTSKFIVICNTEVEAEKTIRWMVGERCYHHIKTYDHMPYFNSDNYHVSAKRYDECHAIHRA